MGIVKLDNREDDEVSKADRQDDDNDDDDDGEDDDVDYRLEPRKSKKKTHEPSPTRSNSTHSSHDVLHHCDNHTSPVVSLPKTSK
ncbi:hypothetical protein Tco_1278202 [Tanacetum coccineum]